MRSCPDTDIHPKFLSGVIFLSTRHDLKEKGNQVIDLIMWTLCGQKTFAVSDCSHDYQIENLTEKIFAEIFGWTKQISSA